MSPITHPDDIFELVAQHIDVSEARRAHMNPTTWQALDRPKRRSIA
jgi:hypothetical protein